MIASVDRPEISAPSSLIDPVIQQGTLLVTQPSSVDFPAPFDPRRETICPRSTVSVTSASAATAPYFADRPVISSMPGLVAQIGLDHLRSAPDLSRRSFADLLAMVEHDDAVADRQYHPHVVLDQQHRDTLAIAQMPHRFGDPSAFLRVHPSRWFIEQQQFGAPGERARELNRFLQAVGQAGYRHIRGLRK